MLLIRIIPRPPCPQLCPQLCPREFEGKLAKSPSPRRASRIPRSPCPQLCPQRVLCFIAPTRVLRHGKACFCQCARLCQCECGSHASVCHCQSTSCCGLGDANCELCIDATLCQLLQAKPWSQALASARNSSESGCGWKTTLSDALPCVNAKLC